MIETWAYDKQRRVGRDGRRWHFARRDFVDETLDYDERPFEIYFRDDERRVFGVLRFERKKENPFRDYETLTNKLMNDAEYREPLLDPDTRRVWKKSWK